MALYCQNHECGEYLGSLGADSCSSCGWSEPQDTSLPPAEEFNSTDAELTELLTLAGTLARHEGSFECRERLEVLKASIEMRLGASVPAQSALAAAEPSLKGGCEHSWTEESRHNGWRSSCRLCGLQQAGSGQ